MKNCHCKKRWWVESVDQAASEYRPVLKQKRPTLVALASDAAPKFVGFDGLAYLDVQAGSRSDVLRKVRIRLRRDFSFSSEIAVFFEIPRFRPMSLTPEPSGVCLSICSLNTASFFRIG